MRQANAPVLLAAPDGRAGVTTDPVGRSVAARFSQWEGLSTALVPVDGHAN
ncbi:hypothetical protein [Nonomuraea sp. NPDC050783]|uniref:hypothetical protein n=1 Tax=Nonomuraea sp. NPDC050783 TaxID=3154634 RepID=UPI00346606A1